MSAIYIFKDDEVLLIHKIKSRFFSTDLWCGIGGHFEKDELNDPETCILRELFEETSLQKSDIADLTLKYITMRKKDEEIRQQYIFFANLLNKNAVLQECDEGSLHWIKINDLSKLKMSYTNTQCLNHYFQQGHKDNLIYISPVNADNRIPEMVFTPLQDFDSDY